MTQNEENPWTRVVWGTERRVWRINLVVSRDEYLRIHRNIQLVVFGDFSHENRVVCTRLPSTGLTTGKSYAAWCDQETVGKGAELIYPPGIANSGVLLHIRIMQIEILGYG